MRRPLTSSVNVKTTPATMPDDNMLANVHASMAKRDRLPAEPLVDKGYTDADVLLNSEREYEVAITGPVAADPSWQAQAGQGFDKSQFVVDWDRQTVTCPLGKQSISWLPKAPVPGVVLEARFSGKDCTPCPSRPRCTKAKQQPRIIGLQTREQHEVLQAMRQRQTTEEFQKQYAARAGIEATHAQAVHRCGLRHSRYIGLAKTHLQHIITAAAINLMRLGDWWMGVPRAPTRCSPFAALQALPVAA